MKRLHGVWVALVCVLLFPVVIQAETTEVLESIRQLANRGERQQALQQIEHFLTQHPEAVQAHFLQGLILARLGRIDDAIAVFKTLTQDHPELPEPHNNLAVLYASQGKYDLARDALLTAIHTHPSYATAHENLGDVYARMARIAYNRALEFDQENKAAQLKLALINNLFTMPTTGTAKVASAAPNHTVLTAAKSTPSHLKPEPSTDREIAAQRLVSEKQRIITALQAWAQAWSTQDVEAYLASYAPDFQPPRSMTRRAWATIRRTRLRRPRFVKVTLSKLQVAMLTDTMAHVTFHQTYTSNIYRDKTDKLLVLKKDEAQWRIVQERAIR